MRLSFVLFLYGAFRLVSGSLVADEDLVHRGSEILPKNIHQRVLPTFAEPPDPLGGLDSRAPEILRRNASQLIEMAQKTRELLATTYDSTAPSKLTPIKRLVQMASRAVLDPTLGANLILAKRWSAWWHRTHRKNPYDTRLNADQFLAYALARMRGEIVATDSINVFEVALDEDYGLIISGMYPAV